MLHANRPGAWQVKFPTDRALGTQALKEESEGRRELLECW